MASDINFMETPLVVWAETFGDGKPMDYAALCSGVFLNDIMQQIDPRPAYQNVNRNVEDLDGRLHNWDLLLRNIRAYYVEVLQQLLIVKLPNIQLICREPEKESSFTEVKKTLLLILGCAVQCERKEHFIEHIKRLDVDVQHAIVEHIKEVTDDTECILPMEPTENLEIYTEKIFNHLTRVLRERDDFAEFACDLAQERDFYQSQVEDPKVPVAVAPTTSPEKHHLVVELADAKAKIRRLRQELEDKQEAVSDMKDELEDNKATISKLRSENMELIQDARAARSLRDELDILREKIGKTSNYESEMTKLKEKLNELEFYKTRVDELREDNAILVETKTMLQDDLDNCHKRVKTVVAMENELVKYRQQIQQLKSERESDRDKIMILTEENAQLEFEKKTNMNESTNLEKELENARLRISGMGGSLSNQLNETTNAKILRLELENQRLQQKLEESQENSLMESSTLNLELEKENQRLSKKVEKLQEANRENSQSCIELEQQYEQLLHEQEQLSHTLETVKESAERQVKELERENENLSQTVETIRARSEKTNDARLKDLERENKRMHETLSTKNQLLSKYEFENRQLQRSYTKIKDNSDRLSELETENANLEKENSELHKSVSTLQLTCDKYEQLEQENSDLEVENRKLQRTVDSLRNTLQRKEQLEQEQINLRVENQKLVRNLESLKNSSSKLVELENDNDSLNCEIQQLRKSLEGQRSQRAKQEQMELDLMDLDNENQKLQKSLEITTNRVQQLERDNADFELENEKLQKTVDTLKLSGKRLNELEKSHVEVENEISRLTREKATLEKEKKRLKQSQELKDSELDDLTTKLNAMEREKRSFRNQLDKHKGSSTIVQELEKENRDLIQQNNMNKKTIAALREDSVNEKIHSQQLKNELEQLTHDLERVGINKEKLVMAEQSHDENRYKALENMMEEALKKSMEIKEEKIHALESRLEESKNRNVKLQDEMRLLKREFECLKQRYEEESHGQDRRENPVMARAPPHLKQNPTRDILDLKDHLVQVERQNATLMAENKNLKTQTSSLNEQIKKLENQNSQFHNQSSSFQDQFSRLQSQNAKLQVDNSSLQSQCATFKAQNASLQSHLDHLKEEHKNLLENHEDLQSTHEHLVQDHEELQRFHEQLTSQYESLISEHGSLKSVHKSVKSECQALRDQLHGEMMGRDDASRVRDQIEREKEQLQGEMQSYGKLQHDYRHLREEHDGLLKKHEKLCKDYRDVIGEHKRLKTEQNTLQVQHSDLQGQCAEYKEQLHQMEMEVNTLANKYDSLYQLNQKMDEDNKNLLMQIQSLINSNQDLLMQILNSKEHFAEEEKSYLEKMSDLRRQKERLEEKIMDHYKRQETQKKNKGLGARIRNKAAKIFVSRNQRSKSKTNLTQMDGSLDNMSQGSAGDTSDPQDSSRKAEKKNGRRGSADNVLNETPNLAKQNRSLAKSTNALNFNTLSPEGFVRGAKSSENLYVDSVLSHGERDSYSSCNSTNLLPGLGRPAMLDDDDGGFRTKSGRNSPSNEMLTLEEFLMEGSKSEKKSSDIKNKEDTESRSSENSDQAVSRRSQQKRHAPAPPSDQSVRASIPDVAAVSHLELNASRLSHISTGSSGSGQESRPDSYGNATPPYTKLPDTSTPAQSNGPFRNGSLEEIDQYSPFQPRAQTDFRKMSMGSTPSSASRTLHYSYSGPSPQPVKSSPHNRELPPTPGEREHIAPADRLDRLMALDHSSSSQNTSVMSGSSGNYNDSVKTNNNSSFQSHNNKEDYDYLMHSKPPMSTRGYPSHSPSGGGVSRNYRSQTPHFDSRVRPVVQQKPPQQHTALQNGPNRPGSVNQNPSRQSSMSNNTLNRNYQDPDALKDNSTGVYSSLDDSRARHSDFYPDKSEVQQVNGPVQGSQDYHYNRVQRIERPKSVPPNMFNKPPDQGGDAGNIYSQPQPTKSGRTPPVPPPRRPREAIVTGRISLIREPGQSPIKPVQSGRMSATPLGQSQGVAVGGSQQLYHGGNVSQSHTPTARITPNTKSQPTYSTPTAPRSMKPEEKPKDPKENALWYEYGCV